MGAEDRTQITGCLKYTRVDEQSSMNDLDDAELKKTENSIRSSSAVSAISVPPRGSEASLMSPSPTTVSLSPKEMKEKNEAAVLANAAAKHLAHQHRRWKMTVKALSSFLSKFSPANGLRNARDRYVRSLANLAANLNSSAACGVTYGAGHSSAQQLPSAWRSGSDTYRRQQVPEPHGFSETFKQSLRETHVSQSCRNFRSVPQIPPARSSSARIYITRNGSLQNMPIYTIAETS